MNLFYAPDLDSSLFTLSKEESRHIVRVLRMKSGDAIHFTNGKGSFFDCRISDDNPNACIIEVLHEKPGSDQRNFKLHLAVAPTKNISRFEWFLEKATEIGIDQISPIICQHSERKEIKHERLHKVITAAVKQSLKSFHPVLKPRLSFMECISQKFDGQKFIAHIDDSVSLELADAYTKGEDATILIGPEGDFSPEEVAMAKENGFQEVKLGPSRLRTETAAVVACHTINLKNQMG